MPSRKEAVGLTLTLGPNRAKIRTRKPILRRQTRQFCAKFGRPQPDLSLASLRLCLVASSLSVSKLTHKKSLQIP